MKTPGSLAEALSYIVPDSIELTAHGVIKDYLAQKFGKAMLDNPECEKVLLDLFETITKRDE